MQQTPMPSHDHPLVRSPRYTARAVLNHYATESRTLFSGLSAALGIEMPARHRRVIQQALTAFRSGHRQLDPHALGVGARAFNPDQ